jgi:Uma2 family endonuclease
MNWQEVCDDPLLRELPYKIELNEWGQIVMSPASNRHGILQSLLIQILSKSRPDGLAFPESPVKTSKGVEVPDVVWVSREFLREHAEETPYPKAPELCVEVLSSPNSPAEMEEKRELYFARGAQEVWLCDEQGTLAFYDCTGPIPASRLFPNVRRIESDYLH